MMRQAWTGERSSSRGLVRRASGLRLSAGGLSVALALVSAMVALPAQSAHAVAPDPADPANLAQTDGSNPIASGGLVPGNGTSVVLSALVSDSDGDTVDLQVEVQPADTAFTDSPGVPAGPTAVSDGPGAGTGGTVHVTVSDLPPGEYHWQAQAVDQNTNPSNWIAFGGGGTDFRVQAPADPTN